MVNYKTKQEDQKNPAQDQTSSAPGREKSIKNNCTERRNDAKK